MATISVVNTDGKEVEKLELSDKIFGVEINEGITSARVHRVLLHVLKYVVVVESLGDRRELVMLDRVLSELHSGQVVV